MEALKGSIELYRQMAANIPNCSIYIFDENFDYLLAEGEELAKNGLDPESLVGLNFFEIWPQEITSSLAPYYQKTLEGNRQKRERRVDNGYFVQHFIPITDEEGEVSAGMVVSQNISELKHVKERLDQADRELREKQRLFETVVNTIAEGILVADREGNMLLHNPAAEKLLSAKIESDSVRGLQRQLDIRRNEEGDEMLTREMPLSVALGGASLDGYVTHIKNKQTGHSAYIENSARPIRDGKGQVESAVLVMRDISYRKENDNLVEGNIAKMDQQNQRLESYLKVFSHGLRGPTANISILLSLLDKADDADEKEMFLSKIREASERLQSTVNGLTESMLAYNSVRQDWAINDFGEVVEDFRKEYKKEIDISEIQLITNFVSLPKLAYPQEYFKNVLFNILSNSTALARPAKNSSISLRSDESQGQGNLRIEISGLDLDLEKVSRKMDGDASPSNYDRGMGFLVAKSHIESLGGTFRVEDPFQLTITF